MSNIKLYNKKIFWKDWFDKQANDLIETNTKIEISAHTCEQIGTKYGFMQYIDLDSLEGAIEYLQKYEFEPFEVEVEDGKVTKAVVRLDYSEKYDITLVFRKNHIITVWLNKKNDTHEDLKRKKYAKN